MQFLRIKSNSFILCSSMCQTDGSWTGKKWRCFQKKCLRPPTIGESHRLECTGNSTDAGSTCKLICGTNSENFGASFKVSHMFSNKEICTISMI